jgi:fibronectin-binding autotransporter adhesin
MKSNLLKPLRRTVIEALIIATTLVTTAQFAKAQTTTWAGVGADQNWATPANWTTVGGSTPPAATDNVIFPNGSFPVSVDGYDNIVTNNTTIGSLSYVNVSPNIHTTHLNDGVTLTVNGPFSEGVASSTTVVTMSGNGNFTVNSISGSFSVGGNGGSTETVTLTMPNGTNTLNLKTLSVGESGGNNGRNCLVNLGAGPTIINADSVNLGTGKASGTLQWTDPTFTNGMVIRDHTGTGRAALQMGTGSSGSGSSKGNILASGHHFDALVTTNILSGCTDTGTGNSAILQFDDGIMDATTILVGRCTSSTGAAAGFLNVGGSTNSATLIVNSPSGPGNGIFTLSASTAVPRASGTLSVSNNGVALIYTSILKARALTNTATINIVGGTLNMEAETNTIGTPAIPIDNFNLDNATLHFYEDGSSLNASVGALSLAETNVFNIHTLPTISILPTTIPIITCTSVASLDGNASNLVLNPLPGSYTGYLTNDGVSAISLVITNGPVFTKPVSWGGAATNLWDTTSFVWTNGTTLTNYSEGDFVTFNDNGNTNTVNLTKAHTPGSLTVNNSAVNYTFTGVGAIKGQTSLIKSGTGSLTLSESGGDSFAGGIFVHGGTLVLDNANSALSSGLTNDSGTVVQIGNNDGNGALPGGNVEIDGLLVFNQASNRTVSALISGTGSVTQAGSNTLTLTGANTYSGNTVVSGGTLNLSGGGMVASPLVAIRNAALNIATANIAAFNALTLTNGMLNIGTGTNAPSSSSLSLSNSTINVTLDYANLGGAPLMSAGTLTTGGSTNFVNVSAIRNLPLSPTVPFNLPLLGYSSATFSGGFNIGWTNLPGISGYITNNAASSSIDLVVTSAPQNLVWTGGSATGNNWSDAANWGGTPIVALDALTFDGLLRTNNVNDTAPGTRYAGLTFQNSAGDAPFTISGAPINLTGAALNNSADVQTISLGLNVTGGVTLNGGTAGGSLAMRGGITNFSTAGQTVTLLGNGTMADLWATNSATNGGGQITVQIGDAGGDWIIVDGAGGSPVQVGNLQLGLNSGSGGGTLEFGSTNSTPNVDAGYPSNGVVNVGATSGTFNMNSGTLKAGSMTVGSSVQGNWNMNGGTLILGTGGFSAGGGVGASIFTGTVTNGSIYATNNGSFVISQRGLGTIAMSGGLLDCNTLNLTTGTAASGNGIFTLSGGRLVCTNISVGSGSGNGSGTLNFNGGILQPGANTAALFKQSNLVPLTNNVQAGGAIFDTAGFNATVNWPLQTDPALGGGPDGGLVKIGTGTLSLTSPDSFIGPTLVGGGTLLVNTVEGASLVTVSNGATLGGNGVLGNNLTVNAGGTLAPGNNTVGVLTVNGNASLSGTTTMEINKTGGTNDLLLATNAAPSTITYGGTLNVVVTNGPLIAGDTFKLFDATNYVGSFATITPVNVTWDTSKLNIDGSLKVVSVASAGPTTNATITKVTLSGANLLVHGTNNNVPNTSGQFVVLTSTNLSAPLSNWTPVFTNTYKQDGTFDYTNPVVPGTPQQFIDVKAQ